MGGFFSLCFKGVSMNQSGLKKKKKDLLVSYTLLGWQAVKRGWE